ncbi:MAG: SDR family NAD(P)-dependent oxidoreductase [Anaerolineae bacterium]|nr:SDR family NAD(P)-dependent oxidoreductase [Anaerolineae bacterium]
MNTQPSQVALITGASSGIGYAAALAFARRGTHVVATARRADRLSALANAVNALPAPHGQILTVAADVTDAEAMNQAVAQTLDHFGRLDILVANAGLGQRGAVVDSPWDDLEVVLRTNIDGVLHSIRAAVPAMRQSGGGHIVIISSVGAQVAMPYTATYGASKAFVSSLAKSLRLELESDHIGVTDMLVGRTETEFNASRRGAARASSSLPAMSADKVAEAILKAVDQNRKTVVLRRFDRLILLGNVLAPGLVARIAKRQYKP